MEPKAPLYKWITGKVSESEEHIKISFGTFQNSDRDQFISVARVGKPKERIFEVEFLTKSDTPDETKMIDAIKKELDFYLIEWGEGSVFGDPWSYAIYHCNTSANIYSHVHWSYFQKGSAAGQKGMHGEVIIEEKIDQTGKKTREKMIYKPDIKI
jgi:hypothetical protein